MHPVHSLAAIIGCVLLFGATPTHAQAPPSSAQASTEKQSGEASAPTIQLGVGPGGMQRHVPGRWAMLAVGGSNPTDQDREETVTVSVDGDASVQYARRVWLPAGASRIAWMPVPIPSDIAPDQTLLDLTSMQIRHSADGVEQFQDNPVGMPKTSRSLLLSKEQSRAAIILDQVAATDQAGNERNEEIADVVNAGRDIEVQDNRVEGMVHVQGHFLPASPVGLDAIDQIVIASDRILNDTLALSRLQSWLQAGGQVWLMTDQVSPEAARMLLGDAMCYSVVDRVELNEIEFETVDVTHSGAGPTIDAWSSERPVEFVRVFTDSADVLCTVDDWPAAFIKKVGRGSVLFTTVGARGWMQDGAPLLPYANISSFFFAGRENKPQPTARLTSFADDEIGYSIPQRHRIAILLGLHLLMIAAAGVWLARRQRLQYLAAIVPVVSLLAAGALVVMGQRQSNAVPSTVAVSQVIRNLPGNPLVNLHSVAAVYSQDAQPLELVSSPDSTTTLKQEQASGQIQRLLWDDSGRSKWLFVDQPPGAVRHAETRTSVEFSPPWSVQGTFSDQGFEGTVQGLPANQIADAIVAAEPRSALAITVDPETGAVRPSGHDAVLAPDQYIDAAIVSDVQRARQQLLREMFAEHATPFGNDPVLLAWTEPVDSGAQFAADFQQRGSALASLPIELAPAPSGTEFHVPATFVQIEPYAGSRGMTAIYNARTGQWLEMNQASEPELQCMMPAEMLPCQLRRASVTIKINAPSRTLDIKALVGDEFQSVYQQSNPTGILRFDIVDPAHLTLNDRGGLVLSLAISESEEELARQQQETSSPTAAANAPNRSTWTIDYVQVDFDATMQ
ncbi:hypothetical protein [Allorhodopirellula solitaria]|uniref:DUF4350 domain-containing protein n=1 Tax=Allorhodopirellula solitaria TaxID=2527987 RepID=A0A5C5XNU9_9BACT|nr:hypothetical protein [Allorhodopirellula solitaria]TWT64857.1 hypothetical protein CA85_36420 [Allorhodopirellula solitaria]